MSDAGVEGHVIQILGRWKSDAYTKYIQMSEEFLRNTMCSMVKCPKKTKGSNKKVKRR